MNTVIHGKLGSPGELDVSVQAAAVLLSLAMRDTESPVTDLGQALSRMVRTVTALRSHATAQSEGKVKGLSRNGDEHRQHLESELSICIQSLQFHDRLIQQLAAVRNLLTSLASIGTLELSGFGAKRWEELLAMLRERLSADEHHQLFDLLMRTGALDNELQSCATPEEGSVELF
jgi:hypothetical protein